MTKRDASPSPSRAWLLRMAGAEDRCGSFSVGGWALERGMLGSLPGIRQDSVSRLEQRFDLLVSTLGGYIGAMGGRAQSVGELPGRPPAALIGITNQRRLGGVVKGETAAARAAVPRRHRRRRAR